MSNLEELLELTKFLEKESKDVNMNDISQVISFLKKYIDCQNKIINVFKENYDRKTIELSKYEQAIDILKDNLCIKFSKHNYKNNTISYHISFKENEFQDYDYTILLLENEKEFELLEEVLGNE